MDENSMAYLSQLVAYHKTHPSETKMYFRNIDICAEKDNINGEEWAAILREAMECYESRIKRLEDSKCFDIFCDKRRK